jgi:fused signal recognition particle receptor
MKELEEEERAASGASEKAHKERAAQERMAAEKKEQETERLATEKAEQERVAAEKLEADRVAAAEKAERERVREEKEARVAALEEKKRVAAAAKSKAEAQARLEKLEAEQKATRAAEAKAEQARKDAEAQAAAKKAEEKKEAAALEAKRAAEKKEKARAAAEKMKKAEAAAAKAKTEAEKKEKEAKAKDAEFLKTKTASMRIRRTSIAASLKIKKTPLQKVKAVSKMSRVAAMWAAKQAQADEEQKRNIFSKDYDASVVKTDRNDANYGKAKAGSASAERARRAKVWVKEQIEILIRVVTNIGDTDAAGNMCCEFGKLFVAYETISDTLVGMLQRSKKFGLVEFEGEMLFQGQSDKVMVTLTPKSTTWKPDLS